MLDIVLEHREKILNSVEKVIRKDYTWMFEAFNQKQINLLSQMVNKHKIKIDIGPVGKEGKLTGTFLRIHHSNRYNLLTGGYDTLN